MDRETLRTWNATAAYALLQGATWSFYAVLLGFSSNLLYDYGFSDSRISLLLGIATGISFLLQLALAELTSRFPRGKVYRVLVAFGAVMLAAMGILLLPGKQAIGVPAFAAACLVLQMIPSFTNGLGMDTIQQGAPTNYSLARGIGSLAYSALAYVTGMLVRRWGTGMIPVLGAVLAGALIVSAVWYHIAAERGLPEPPARRRAETEPGFLKKYPRFTVFLAGAVFLCLSHNLLCDFMYQIMLTKGGGAEEQGVATAISAIVELPVMFLFPALLRLLRCDKWVRISAACMSLKALGIFLSATPYGVYAAQATQMLGFGLYAISSVNYAELVVGPGESVRAQSYLGSTVTVGALIALSTGGVICQYLGPQAMVLASLGCSILGGGVVILAAREFRGKR